ncbi:MAG TPA: HAD family hydrolase [Devosia sp.]|nr:HAD family hydrolase [Devosia sp.]
MNIRAIATDYDGTLAENDVAPPSTIAALARFRQSGRRLILVTGRHLPDLKEVFGGLPLFDIVVAENGGLLYFPRTDAVRTLAARPPRAFVDRLRQLGVDELMVGQTIVATHVGHHEAVRRTIAQMAPELEIILNTDALMVLPAGINKASGLRAALVELDLDPSLVAAIGDAENDIVFLRLCGVSVAVANALPEVKSIASVVTSGARGAGVEEFIASVLSGTGASR